MQVHAFTRSLAAHVFPPGDSFDSGPGVPKGVTVAPVACRDGIVVRRRGSKGVVGVEGSYMTGDGLRGTAFGRAL